MDDTDSPSIICQLRGYQVNQAKLRNVARAILENLGLADFELSVRLVGSAGIRKLNRAHRGIDKATDVLSFPQEEWAKPVKVKSRRVAGAKKPVLPPRALGDVVISLPDAERNAKKIGQELDREVCFLLVHGILHLGGHDHMKKADERMMLKEQRALMARLTPRSGRPLWSSSVKRKTAKGRR